MVDVIEQRALPGSVLASLPATTILTVHAPASPPFRPRPSRDTTADRLKLCYTTPCYYRLLPSTPPCQATVPRDSTCNDVQKPLTLANGAPAFGPDHPLHIGGAAERENELETSGLILALAWLLTAISHSPSAHAVRRSDYECDLESGDDGIDKPRGSDLKDCPTRRERDCACCNLKAYPAQRTINDSTPRHALCRQTMMEGIVATLHDHQWGSDGSYHPDSRNGLKDQATLALTLLSTAVAHPPSAQAVSRWDYDHTTSKHD
ncbi:hypothetical protein DFP72DRAFT_1072013 [Ephemerocybe angulata]|uniref:Uncharacterized protein n=1 Tax=Ephemerocybe angulata TaxID=980116 RepID=A0A8H6M469_9AGAR|nr:hypothetical protein DFP72DRAFT_1072013 [Tulosesus angulatus]